MMVMSGNEGTKYVGVVSCEEALEREKQSFVLDKTIIKVICSEGPVSIEDIRRKTLPLEAAIGMKIDLPKIQSVIDRLINEGLIAER